MGSIRIAILSANNTQVAFMDNAHKKSMHYWGDELHVLTGYGKYLHFYGKCKASRRAAYHGRE